MQCSPVQQQQQRALPVPKATKNEIEILLICNVWDMCVCVEVRGTVLYCIAWYCTALYCTLLLYLQHPDFPALLSPPCLGAALLAFTEMALPGFTEAFLGFWVAMLFLLTDLYISTWKEEKEGKRRKRVRKEGRKERSGDSKTERKVMWLMVN